MSWYLYLNRDQQYQRSYRTHNLWLDQYAKKMRTPRVHALHIGLMRKLAKNYSNVSFIRKEFSTLNGLYSQFLLFHSIASCSLLRVGNDLLRHRKGSRRHVQPTS